MNIDSQLAEKASALTATLALCAIGGTSVLFKIFKASEVHLANLKRVLHSTSLYLHCVSAH